MEKHADLLNATEDYIVQQCCCTAVKPHGLSAAIAARWPSVNPYTGRRRLRYNWAKVEDRPSPGTIQVLEKVICLFGQYTHSKPGVYEDPAMTGTPDSYDDRLRYFQMGLEEISKLRPKSVAFPFKIGCGLAGGDWKKYKQAIDSWAGRNADIEVVIYVLPGIGTPGTG